VTRRKRILPHFFPSMEKEEEEEEEEEEKAT